jgi:hypothetical protein
VAVDLKTLLLAAAALAVPAGAFALGAHDPFAPPRAGVPAALVADPPAAAADGLAGLRAGCTPLALIDGAWHRVGAVVRGARLARIDRHGVLLAHPDGRLERLWLVARP